MSDQQRRARSDGARSAQPTEESQATDERERQKRSSQSAAAARIADQHLWVDQQIRIAMERGDFDNLAGAGKPIAGLDKDHDPDWWLNQLIERERIVVLPPSVQLRKDDAVLDDALDKLFREDDVRREVADFNARVLRARYSPQDGQPPLVTMPRDVEETVAEWIGRREARRAASLERRAEGSTESASARRRTWWRRRRTS
ncbi:DUF1992 domain-containing protein [Nocardioides sp.]|uniref:DnaJ family domain-containing protein n=1 Tax=Nocardioides sp. TaxID=35761 RepID=UPI002B26FF98|nr:DUF1992 domain-containing protein [Nocardioides sp.]